MSSNDTELLQDSATSSSSFVRWLVAGVALINLFVFAMVAFSLYQSFGEVEERAEVTAQNLSRLLAEDICGDLDKIDVALLSVADEIERQLASGSINKQALNTFMGRQQKRLLEIISLRATDAKGIVSYGQGVNPGALQNNSDREYFTRQRDNPNAGLAVTKPVFARIDKKWVVPISRSIRLPDGSFGGAVYVNVSLDFLSKTFSTIDVGRHGSVYLYDAEQRFFAAYPAPDEVERVIGVKFAAPELQALIQARRDAGMYVSKHTIDGVERKFAVYRAPAYPLYIVVGRATEEYMAPWKDQAIKMLALAALFFLATLISSWMIFRDINERKQAEAAMCRLNTKLEQRVAQRTAQLEAANKELEEFSYSMSHDMRTPLRALNGFSKILLEDHSANLDDEGKRLLKVLRDNSQHMGRLVDDILRFLNISRRKMDFTAIDIAKLASETAAELQAANPARSLRFEIGTLSPVWGDHDMLREVLHNLFSNALKFSPADAEAVIELGGIVKEGESVYSVRDHGVGFDMRFADKLFRVFERVHATGQYEGSGIGLALVKRIVTRHGGRVWAEGKVNEGATIYFALPTKEKNHGQ